MGKIPKRSSAKRVTEKRRATAVRFDEYLLKQLKDRKFAAKYLTACFQEESERSFVLAMHDVSKAQGGVTAFAERSRISRQHLHRIFSGKSSPTLETLQAMLRGLGYTLDVVPVMRVA